MRIGACKPGVRVLYQPVHGVSQWFEGVVRETPWQLGDGTFVTHLHQMEPAYGLYRNAPTKTTIHAVIVARLKLAPQQKETPSP